MKSFLCICLVPCTSGKGPVDIKLAKEKLSMIPGVYDVYPVTGTYDLLVEIIPNYPIDLKRAIDSIRNQPFVRTTMLLEGIDINKR